MLFDLSDRPIAKMAILCLLPGVVYTGIPRLKIVHQDTVGVAVCLVQELVALLRCRLTAGSQDFHMHRNDCVVQYPRK